MQVRMSSEQSRLGKSESPWSRLVVLVAKYSARVSVLLSNDPLRPLAVCPDMTLEAIS